MDYKKEIEKLNSKRAELEKPEFIEKQHQKGKLTARERINLLLDPESFTELDLFVESRFNILGLDQKKLPGDAVITGFGKINNRQVYLYSQDFSRMGGSLGEMHGNKIVKVIELAQKTGSPIIGIIDSGGARIQEGISSLDGYAAIFRSTIKASGVIPQITVIAGPSAGGASYTPGLSDFVFMVEGISQMYITGPEVIKAVTGEKISFDELGGATIHSLKSGCCHFVFKNEQDCFLGVKKLLSYLPQNNLEDPPKQKSFLSELFEKENYNLLKIVPEREEKGYNMKEVIQEIFDKNSFFEIQAGFAANVITGFCRLSGQVVGIIANQTKFMAGTLDIDSSDKVIIRHGAKVLYAFAEATVPKISLILRKAFGGAYIALASRYLGYDKIIAWPSSRIAVMGPEQAVKIIYKKEIAESKEPKKLEKEKIQELKELFLNPYQAAKLGQVDMIIHPKDTRTILIKCLESLLNKRESKIARKHGNMPL